MPVGVRVLVVYAPVAASTVQFMRNCGVFVRYWSSEDYRVQRTYAMPHDIDVQ